MNIEELKEMAKKIRKHIVEMTCEAGSGHPGGALSATDIITVLYFHKMKYDPKNPSWPERDRFILSKGHACPALYAALAEAGYFPVEELKTLRRFGSRLQGHPDKLETPGVEASTGSLGQGLSFGVGVALAGKLDKKKYNVYVLIGDGESQEGMIWEASMAAAHYKLDNLTAILDYNHLQIDGPVEKVMNIAPVFDKWKAFGWHVVEVNGHDIPEIIKALAEKIKGKPTMIIAHTTKGKGVSFMENVVSFHGKACTKEQLPQALNDIEGMR